MSYLFYTLYNCTAFVSTKNNQSEHTANTILALILSFTVFAITNALEYFELLIFQNIWRNIYVFIVMYLSFIFIGYLYFIRNEKYLELIAKWKNKSKLKKVLRVSIVLLFLILLLFLNFGLN